MTPLCIADQLLCAHGGKLTITASAPDIANIKGNPLITITDIENATITACPFMVGTTPKPCTKVVSASGSASSTATIKGKPMALAEKISSATTDNGAPIMLAGAPLASGVMSLKS